MIDLTLEKKSSITPQEVHEICEFAMQDAEVNGFVSSYDFSHAIWVYAADIIFEDKKDDIVEKITTEGMFAAYQMLLEDGTLEALNNDYQVEMQQIADASVVWYNDYIKYATSIRGTLNAFQTYSGGILQDNVNQLFQAQTNPDLKNVYDIANKWGLNNDNPSEGDSSLFFEA